MAAGLLESMDYKGGGLLERTHCIQAKTTKPHITDNFIPPQVHMNAFLEIIGSVSIGHHEEV